MKRFCSLNYSLTTGSNLNPGQTRIQLVLFTFNGRFPNIMSMFKIFIAALSLMLVGSICHAGQGEEQLRAFINDLQSLQTEFTQDLYDEAGTKIDSASGMLYLQRPGKFHWQYQQPYEQQILTNGETLWIYDSDLEQVTVRDVASNLQSTPAAILGGTANIDELYEITDMGELEGAHWVRLSSLDDESQYSDVRLGFEANELGMMIMSDNLGQTTRIDFSNTQRNVELDENLFDFDAPENVDVLDDRQSSVESVQPSGLIE